MGLMDRRIYSLLQIGGFTVHLTVDPVPHILDDPYAFKIQIALAGAYDLKEFRNFVSFFYIYYIIIFLSVRRAFILKKAIVFLICSAKWADWVTISRW